MSAIVSKSIVLNASVAAALCLQTVLLLYGEAACGDLAREAPPAEMDDLRRRWARALARDSEQAARMEAALDAAAPLHDLRRHDVYREHTGRPQLKDRKSARRDAGGDLTCVETSLEL